MANFFRYFPLTLYASANNNNSLDTVTNITARFGFLASIKENSSAFYPYEVKDSDTPEIIAAKYYDDPEKHWIVLLFNDIIDPQYNWPLKYSSFINYVNEKYAANGASNTTVQSGITWAQSQNNIHSYYKTVTRSFVSSGPEDKIISEKIQITANTFANVAVTSNTYTLQNGRQITETVTKEKLTYYEYEMQQNEAKREIRLLKPQFVETVMEEFKQLMNP